MTKKGERFLENIKIKPFDFVAKIIAIKNYYSKAQQHNILAEECVELAKEALKAIRCDYNNREALIEELADVYIMIQQIMLYNKISLNTIYRVTHKKLDRQIERIKEEIGYYKDEGAEAKET